VGIFKKKNGEATAFTKAFANKSGKPSTFAKVLGTALTVIDFVPAVGEVSMVAHAGVIGATKVATKTAAKVAEKTAVKKALEAGLKAAKAVTVKEGLKAAQTVSTIVNTKAAGIYNQAEKSSYDYVGAKAGLGDARETPIKVAKPKGFIDWLVSLFS
jgi:hypothetical protein